MIPQCNNEIWYVLLYCVLLFLLFFLVFLLADNLKRKREALTGALLNLVLISVLSMLSSYAAEALNPGLYMTAGFQLTGVLICSMAVSRVLQMLNWWRTWLLGIATVLVYLLGGLLLGWLMVITLPH